MVTSVCFFALLFSVCLLEVSKCPTRGFLLELLYQTLWWLHKNDCGLIKELFFCHRLISYIDIAVAYSILQDF